MHAVDYILIALYLGVLLYLGFIKRLKPDSSVSELIIGGRMLTLPAFIASLVSTWYGGILAVGEYTYKYGLSNWLVFGLPYYLSAFIFAIFLARKARESKVMTIPQRLAQAYDKKTALAGSIIIFLMTVPAAYILMLGVLCKQLFGIPLWMGVLTGSIFSVCYVYLGAFKSVVRTDLLQFVLMFAGFIVLFVVLINEYGGLGYLTNHLPANHLTWHGGNSRWYIASWYIIALAALIEPTFHQRCYAAKDSGTARNGILISIVCWAVFDFLTTTCGLYARAILPNLTDPLSSFPALAQTVLPAGLMGMFALALLSTVMSTVDSNSFVAASTFGNDIMPHLFRTNGRKVTRYTRLGLILSTVIAVLFAVFFKSAIDIWHAFGSVGTPALLVPVFTSFVGQRNLPSKYALISIITSGGLSAIWYISKYTSPDETFWFGLEPIFPGVILSIIIFILFSRKTVRQMHQG